MNQTQAFAAAVGRKEIAKAAGVGMTAVSNAVIRGRFPSSWFLICQGLAERAGVDCPAGMFGMREPADDGGTI